MQRESMTPSDVDTLLNKRSGLLGISEVSNDMREIIEAMDAGSERHRLAFEMFCHRVRKYVGGYAAVLRGLDAVVFTGGIGENAARVRQESLVGLEILGIELDPEANEGHETMISTGPTAVLVIPTNEELAIARDTAEVLERSAREAASAVTDEALDRELAALSVEDRRELVLLWAADPGVELEQLRDRLAHKIRKQISVRALCRELERVGLLPAQAGGDLSTACSQAMVP
jgi:acetate kinase